MENRTEPRIATDSLCRARFRIGGKACRNIAITDLGQGGCRIRVPVPAVPGLKQMALLEDWRFTHPALPRQEIKARVMWCRGPAGLRGRYLEAGLRFQELPAGFRKEVEHYLTCVANPGTPDLDFSGMPA